MTTQACEVILRWRDNTQPEYCDRLAVGRYPAMGGGWMYLCEEHVGPHRAYVEGIEQPASSSEAPRKDTSR